MKGEDKKTASPVKTSVKTEERSESKAKSTTSNKDAKPTEKKEKDVLSFDKIKVCTYLKIKCI